MKNREWIHKIIKKLHNSRGAASVVEYTIVLPICMFIVIFLFFAGYFLNERAVLDAAAHRSVLVAQKIYGDSKFSSFTDLSYTDTVDYVGFKRNGSELTDISNKPYRYLFGSDKIKELVRASVEKKAISCIINNQLFSLGNYIKDTKVEVGPVEGIVVKSVTVVITEEYKFPGLLRFIGFKGNYIMQGAATTTFSDQTELIHNIDLVVEFMEDIGADKFIDKIRGFFKKIGNFVTSLGGEEGGEK